MIYLDNAATSFPKSENVYLEMDWANRNLSVNSGRGSYKAAKEASEIISETREKLLELFNAKGIANVILTPSITHAINQVLYGLELSIDSVVYISPYEHNAVARCVELLRQRHGFIVKMLPLQKDLQIDLDKVQYEFSMNPPTLLIINAMSNVTGYVLPVQELSNMAKQFKCTVMLDTAQAAGLIDVDMRKLQADVICFAGHKSLGGPFGIGGFLLNNAIILERYLAGGTGSNSLNLSMPEEAPGRYEASSPNIIAIAGLLAALKELNGNEHNKKIKELTEYAIMRLLTIPDIKILGQTPGQLGIVSFVLPGYNSNDIGEILDNEFDTAVRTGYHCCPYIHDFLGDKEYGGTVRIGLGMKNNKEDIDWLVQALRTL